MRALPLLVSLASVMVMGSPRAAGAAGLWPLSRALGAQSATAQVEVYAARAVETRPKLRTLEQEMLPGALWHRRELGNGEVLEARLGVRSARIAYVPVGGSATLVCASVVEVPAADVDQALGRSATPPCGVRHEVVTVRARLPERPTAARLRAVLRVAGVVSRGIVHGPEGMLALAEAPGLGPDVAIGGVPVNLAVQITYDSAHGARAVLATPMLPGSAP